MKPVLRWKAEPRENGLPTKAWTSDLRGSLTYLVERQNWRRPHRQYEVYRTVGASTKHTMIGSAPTLRAAQRIACGDVLMAESGRL